MTATRCRVPTCPEVWRCRNCSRKTCEHRCSFKMADKAGKTAICGRCVRVIAEAAWKARP